MNNPMAGTDPTGYVIETVWDVANVIYDVGKIGVGYATGNSGLVEEGAIDLAVDSASTLIPFVPAGASKVVRGGAEGVDRLSDARKVDKVAPSNGASKGQSPVDRSSSEPASIGKQSEASKQSNGAEAPRVTKNSREGARRQAETKAELQQQHPEASVQSEQYLRTSDGKIAKDPLTGEGRRIDNVVIKDKKVIESVETTSPNASKARQSQKEKRIRESGGTFVRDRETREVVPVTCPTRTDRRC